MNYRYRLSDDPRNSGTLYRTLNGITYRKDRWLLSEKKLSIAGYEGMIIEEEENVAPAPIPVPVEPTPEPAKKIVVREPVVQTPAIKEPSTTRSSLYKQLKDRGFPDSELTNLSRSEMIRLMEMDEEITNDN
jgi:hypothetical protein